MVIQAGQEGFDGNREANGGNDDSGDQAEEREGEISIFLSHGRGEEIGTDSEAAHKNDEPDHDESEVLALVGVG